jgi:hypothetical protein
MTIDRKTAFLLAGIMMLALAKSAHPFPAGDPTPGVNWADAGRWLHVEDAAFVDPPGRRIVLRGIQLDFGSLRGDIGFPIAEGSREDEFCDRMLEHVLSEEVFRDLRQMGANAVRLSLNTYLDYEIRPLDDGRNALWGMMPARSGSRRCGARSPPGMRECRMSRATIC